MMVPRITLLLALVDYVLTDEIGSPDGCLSAETQCSLDPDCNTRLRTLSQCTTGSGAEHLQPAARNECMIAARALQSHQLFTCKCKRGMKKEKSCLRIFWTMHQSHVPGYNDFEASPYEYSMPGPTWGLDYSRLASLVSEGPKVQPANVNHCLDAAKACNVDETCKQFRTEYAKYCLKPASRSGCNKHKCHKSLRRFFDIVPEEYKYPVLFCPCEDRACTERRRQTIVPACSFEEPDKQNCLNLQDTCKADVICKSRLADFQTNCQPSKKSASYCFGENYNACLQSYTGLIGTVLTPNYVSNSSSDISIWCTCVNSGNQHEECENLLNLFTSNSCLRNSINSYANSLQFHSSENKQPALTTTERLSFNLPGKDSSCNGASVSLDSNQDSNRGDKLTASKEKSLREKITDCNTNSGTDIQSLVVMVPYAITSLYIFMFLIENAI